MAMLSAIVEAGPRRMGALRPISDRLGLDTLCIVTLGALFGLAASAQQNHEPRSETAPPAATAPSPPASLSSAAASWQQSLVARFASLQRYPPKARGAQGVVSLAFTIDRHGNAAGSSRAPGRHFSTLRLSTCD
jgi:hypothetical protein